MEKVSFPAGFVAAVILLGASCGIQNLKPGPAPPVVFPLAEASRIRVKAPLVPRLGPGPQGLVLAASTAGDLQAVDPEAKSVKWTFSAGPSSTPPCADGERIFWAAEDGNGGKIFGLDAEGRVLWTRMLDEPVRGDLRIVSGRLVFREGETGLTALNAVDGTPAWRDPASLPAEWTAGEKRIVVRTAAGDLRLLDAAGRLVREIRTGETSAGSLGLSGDIVYLGYEDGRFGAFDLATGKRKWTIRLGGIPVGSPVSDGRVVLVILSNHVLAALRAGRGDLLWWRPLPARAGFPPLLYRDHVFAASRSSVWQAFDLEDGAETTAYAAPGEILAPPVRTGSKIFLATGGESDESEEGDLILVLDLAPASGPDQPGAAEKKK
jgi:outer membrane protein assembly factor BamB